MKQDMRLNRNIFVRVSNSNYVKSHQHTRKNTHTLSTIIRSSSSISNNVHQIKSLLERCFDSFSLPSLPRKTKKHGKKF